MSDEITNQEPAATDAMQRSIEALERKNSELITELRAAKSKASKVPDGVNVDELLEFKRTHEQQQLESQGNYTEARQALEQQYREATAQKDQRIESLEAKVRELELIAPAVTALAEIVHDPDLVLRSKLSADKIEREPDGTRPQGSGAPSTGSNAGQAPLGKNPFATETFNLTEQSRLFRTDRDLYDRMKAAAQR